MKMAKIIIALLLVLAGSVSAKDHERQARFLNSEEAGKLGLPFSEAVRAGDFLHLSGQLGNVPGEKTPVAGGVVPESRQALLNIQRVLDRHGSSIGDVIKCTVFLADMADWPKFNEVYREFSRHPIRREARWASMGWHSGRASRSSAWHIRLVRERPYPGVRL